MPLLATDAAVLTAAGFRGARMVETERDFCVLATRP
jgi:hypothetical protein